MKSKKKTGTIGWIDLTVEDAPDIRNFYQEVAGWSSQAVSMGDYDDYCMKPPDGEVVAGICHARASNQGLPPVWLIYITVESLDHSIEHCRKLGGKVVVEPKGIGEQGRYCVIRDPAGAHCALFEPALES